MAGNVNTVLVAWYPVLDIFIVAHEIESKCMGSDVSIPVIEVYWQDEEQSIWRLSKLAIPTFRQPQHSLKVVSLWDQLIQSGDFLQDFLMLDSSIVTAALRQIVEY